MGVHRFRSRVVAARGRGAIAALALFIGVSAPSLSWSQDVSPAGRAQLEASFAEILKDPTNLDLTYDYAQLATSLGDYEAAITAYERLLLFNPDLPRVKAELGVLYYRLGSFDTAKAYLEQALAEGDPPPAARARIEGFLARIEETESRHQFTGGASFGLRYQTNANYGPENDILIADIPAVPDDEIAGDADWNVFGSLSGRYVYDLGNDAGDFFSVEGTLYGSRQFKFTELDVEHMRVTAGPGFRLYPKESGPVLFRPTVRATYVRLDNESYHAALGFGASATWQAFDQTSLFANGFYENRDYMPTEKRPNAGTQDGAAVRATAGAIHRLSPNLQVKAEATGGRVYTDEGAEAYSEAGFGVSVAARTESPFMGSEDLSFLSAPWSLSASLRYAHRRYEAPNFLVSAERRKEDDIRIDGAIAVPVGDRWSVFATLGYQDNISNLPNNDFENFSAALGASVKF